jgi:hypothetical protein
MAPARLMSLSAADRLAILEVITRADDAASLRDANGYVTLFTPDAEPRAGTSAGRNCAQRSGRYGPVRARPRCISPSTRSSGPARPATRL